MKSESTDFESQKYKPDFDFKKIKINDVGKYSMTRPYEAKQIVTIIQDELKMYSFNPKNCIITDGTCGVGGDTIHFSKYFKSVNAVDILIENGNILYENCKTFKIKNVNIFTNNYLNIHNILKEDILYLDPPWGGIDYKSKDSVKLVLSDLNMNEILDLIKSTHKKPPMIYIKVPLNVDFNYIPNNKKYTIYNKKNTPTFYLLSLRI